MTGPLGGPVLLALALAALAAAPQGLPAERDAIELIVKFATASDPETAIARASGDSDAPPPEVTAHVEEIARELGAPLTAARLGSGGTVILTVRAGDLEDALARRVRAEGFVKSARIIDRPGDSKGAVAVQLVPGTPEDASLRAAGGDSEALKLVVDRLEQASKIPLDARVEVSGELLLRPELEALANDLVARLRKRADVRYAQKTYVYQIR